MEPFKVSCEGQPGHLHETTFIELTEDGPATCPVCGRVFTLEDTREKLLGMMELAEAEGDMDEMERLAEILSQMPEKQAEE